MTQAISQYLCNHNVILFPTALSPNKSELIPFMMLAILVEDPGSSPIYGSPVGGGKKEEKVRCGRVALPQ